MQLGHQRNPAGAASQRDLAVDYDVVRRVIPLLSTMAAAPPSAAELAALMSTTLDELERAIRAWCGLSPAVFAQALTAEHIRARLARARSWPEVHGCVHAFETRIVAAITDDARRRGAGLDIAHGFHASPFGEALLLTTQDGLCGLAFVDDESGPDRQAALDDMAARWPRARFHEAPQDTANLATCIFGEPATQRRHVVPLVLIGTPFDLQVWQALLQIPIGQLVSYTQIAQHLGRPSASRAVGTANGRNPISFVVPCHRALRGDGSLGGYYWGLTRKRAMIAWEARTDLAD